MIRNFISKLYSLYTPSFFISGGGSANGYVIERSLRFSSASSQYLTRTFGTPTNNTVWTLSLWLKRGSLWTIRGLFTAGSAGIVFNASNQLAFVSNAGATLATSTRVFRDPSTHGHLHVTSNGTTIEAYWNNELALSYTGTITNLNSAITHNIGRTAVGANQYFDGYGAEDIFVDGQVLARSLFAESNQATGQWVAKKYTGTYGTNGFYLDFKDGASTTTLGYDKSGNNNHWTLTNFTRSAGVDDCWMLDVPAGNGSASAVQPSGNYAVLNQLKEGGNGTFTNANLNVVTADSTGIPPQSTIVIPDIDCYWEATYLSANVAPTGIGIIAVTSTSRDSNSVYYCPNGTKATNGSTGTYGSSYTKGDTIGFLYKAVAGTLECFKNNTPQGVIASGLGGGYVACISGGRSQSASAAFNFGQRSFVYTPPAGAKALCTANLPTPTIKKPSDHFNVQLSTGANIKTDSEALFTNELEWIKDRANTNNHQLIDSVRGTNAVLQSNTTAAETTYTAPSGSSVGWVWRASDSAAVTNNVGTISSQVSANPTAGFSIVAYTGTGVNATVGHGLGIAPKMIIVKNRPSSVNNWQVYHANLTSAAYCLVLNSTSAQESVSAVWNSTAPTASVFSIGTHSSSNGVSNAMVAYCFAEIAGYSKFGSYRGNGSAEGINVTLGFKPRFIMLKRTDSTSAWVMYDSARATYTTVSPYIQAQASAAEASAVVIDANSNGFKLRTSGDPNVNDGTYIYMAFAECPINYANAR